MQIFKTQKGTIYLGRITELAPEFNLLKKEKEKIALKNLLSKSIGERSINYSSLGEPLISDQEFISISHSGDYICIYISELSPVGVDIQSASKNISSFKSAFVNETDNLSLSNDRADLFKLWGAKESYFKEHGGKIKDLKKDVSLVLIDSDQLILKGNGKTFTYGYLTFDNYYLVFSN